MTPGIRLFSLILMTFASLAALAAGNRIKVSVSALEESVRIPESFPDREPYLFLMISGKPVTRAASGGAHFSRRTTGIATWTSLADTDGRRADDSIFYAIFA